MKSQIHMALSKGKEIYMMAFVYSLTIYFRSEKEAKDKNAKLREALAIIIKERFIGRDDYCFSLTYTHRTRFRWSKWFLNVFLHPPKVSAFKPQ